MMSKVNINRYLMNTSRTTKHKKHGDICKERKSKYQYLMKRLRTINIKMQTT